MLISHVIPVGFTEGIIPVDKWAIWGLFFLIFHQNLRVSIVREKIIWNISFLLGHGKVREFGD